MLQLCIHFFDIAWVDPWVIKRYLICFFGKGTKQLTKYTINTIADCYHEGRAQSNVNWSSNRLDSTDDILNRNNKKLNMKI